MSLRESVSSCMMSSVGKGSSSVDRLMAVSVHSGASASGILVDRDLTLKSTSL